jgi:hypothetical protein
VLSWPWQRPKPIAVFRFDTTDGKKHEVAGASLFEWLALRTAEEQALPSQADMRDMLRHLDDGAADKALFALIRAALPKAITAARNGRAAMEQEDFAIDVDLSD